METINYLIQKKRFLFWLITVLAALFVEKLAEYIFGTPIFLSITYPYKDVVKQFDIPLWLVLISLLILYVLISLINASKERKSLNELISNIATPDKEQTTNNTNNQAPNSIPDCSSMLTNKVYFDSIVNLFEKKKALLSIQLYECSELIDPSLCTDNEFVYKVKRIGGYSRNGFITNCILYEEYHCPLDFYEVLYSILNRAKNFKVLIDGCDSYNHHDFLAMMEEIRKLILKIIDEYLIFDNHEKVEEKHYFYFKSLIELVSILRWAYDIESSINGDEGNKLRKKYVTQFNSRLLKCSQEIENELKRGKRTGMLSTMFVGDFHAFVNDSSFLKHGRHYFVVHSHKNDNRFFLFTYDSKYLKQTKQISLIERCTSFYNGIEGIVDYE